MTEKSALLKEQTIRLITTPFMSGKTRIHRLLEFIYGQTDESARIQIMEGVLRLWYLPDRQEEEDKSDTPFSKEDFQTAIEQFQELYRAKQMTFCIPLHGHKPLSQVAEKIWEEVKEMEAKGGRTLQIIYILELLMGCKEVPYVNDAPLDELESWVEPADMRQVFIERPELHAELARLTKEKYDRVGELAGYILKMLDRWTDPVIRQSIIAFAFSEAHRLTLERQPGQTVIIPHPATGSSPAGPPVASPTPPVDKKKLMN